MFAPGIEFEKQNDNYVAALRRTAPRPTRKQWKYLVEKGDSITAQHALRQMSRTDIDSLQEVILRLDSFGQQHLMLLTEMRMAIIKECLRRFEALELFEIHKAAITFWSDTQRTGNLTPTTCDLVLAVLSEKAHKALEVPEFSHMSHHLCEAAITLIDRRINAQEAGGMFVDTLVQNFLLNHFGLHRLKRQQQEFAPPA